MNSWMIMKGRMRMQRNNPLAIWIVVLLLILFASPILKLAFNIIIGLIIGLVIFGVFTYFSTKKKVEDAQKQAKMDDVYEHFYENKTIGESGFDKDAFFSNDQFHDGDIIDAKVEPLSKKGNDHD